MRKRIDYTFIEADQLGLTVINEWIDCIKYNQTTTDVIPSVGFVDNRTEKTAI
jgi:hypothetical protein